MTISMSNKSRGGKAGPKPALPARKAAASDSKLSASAAKTARTKKAAAKTSKAAAATEPKAAAHGHRARDLAALVKKGLPGYMLVKRPREKAERLEDNFMKIDQGPSLADLKRKFFGDEQADAADDAFDSDDGRISVRVRPEHGGDAKTADIGPDGKITIVQG